MLGVTTEVQARVTLVQERAAAAQVGVITLAFVNDYLHMHVKHSLFCFPSFLSFPFVQERAAAAQVGVITLNIITLYVINRVLCNHAHSCQSLLAYAIKHFLFYSFHSLPRLSLPFLSLPCLIRLVRRRATRLRGARQ
jgi:hypothetical protein